MNFFGPNDDIWPIGWQAKQFGGHHISTKNIITSLVKLYKKLIYQDYTIDITNSDNK